ncbi:hypothetical protein Avbf_16661, partial [Armadillidium vulgare]
MKNKQYNKSIINNVAKINNVANISNDSNIALKKRINNNAFLQTLRNRSSTFFDVNDRSHNSQHEKEEETKEERTKTIKEEATTTPPNKDHIDIADRILSIVESDLKRSKVERLKRYLKDEGTFLDLNYEAYGESEDLREHARRLGVLTYWDIKIRRQIESQDRELFCFPRFSGSKVV